MKIRKFNLVGLASIRALNSRLLREVSDDEVIRAIMSVPMHYTDLAITATTVVPVLTAGAANCIIRTQLILGATLTAGQVVYQDQTTNPAGQLKACLAGGTAAQRNVFGILLNGGSAGQAAQVAIGGQVNFTSTPALVNAKEYYMSVTAGSIADAQPASTNYAVRIGYGTATGLQIDLKNLGQVP